MYTFRCDANQHEGDGHSDTGGSGQQLKGW